MTTQPPTEDYSDISPLSSGELDQLLRDVRSGSIPIEGWRHPLGFVHARLHAELPWKVRLHFWPDKMDAEYLGTVDRIHNHSFDFVSHILAGAVLERRYVVRVDSMGALAAFMVTNAGGQSALNDTGVAYSMGAVHDFHHVAGQHYHMRAGAFHDAIAVENETATLVLARARADVSSLVLAPPGYHAPRRIWPSVDTALLRALVARLRLGQGAAD